MPSQRKNGRAEGRLRRHILARDNWICHICGHPGADTMDHLIPWSHGGTNTLDNLRAAHRSCNSRRGDRPITHQDRTSRRW